MSVTSQNSSKPPSQDPNRKKKAAKNDGSKKPGGQHGHVGKVLAKVETPDEVQIINWDKAKLPVGEYEEAGYCTRQVLDRLSDFETETLRFSHAVDVPFTNNLAENNIRMTKVQQKISGCFRSLDNAQIFCRIRSYTSTCRKHGIAITEALKCLFDGKDPPFMQDWTG